MLRHCGYRHSHERTAETGTAATDEEWVTVAGASGTKPAEPTVTVGRLDVEPPSPDRLVFYLHP